MPDTLTEEDAARLRAENERLKQRVKELEAAKNWLVSHLAAMRLRSQENGQ